MYREIGPLGRADKVIEKVTMVAAPHESAHGTNRRTTMFARMSRHFSDLGRFPT
jgi:hypothetical protein